MLRFVQDKTEEFFDDFSYNGKRTISYILGKSGISAVAPGISSALGDSLGPTVASALSGSSKGMLIAAPLSAAFSAALAQGDFLHQRKKVLEQYRPEIVAWLGNGKKPEEVTMDDLYLAAYGDKKRDIPGNPTLAEALTQACKERNWNVGISVTSTTASTFVAHAAEHRIKEFITDNLTTDTTGVTALTMLSLGTIGFAIYQAIKTPLHWLAECCFGVEKETVNDKIGEIRRLREDGKMVSQERVFEAYIQAHPEIDDMVYHDYGKPFSRLRAGKKAEVLQLVGEQLKLEDITRDINSGFIRPEELAFITFGQVSGVSRRDAPVRREERPQGSLTKLAGRAAVKLGFGKKGQVKVEDAIESIPSADDLPTYIGLQAATPDGNTQMSMQAYHDEAPGRKVSFVEKVGRKRGDNGAVSFVEQVESSRSENYVPTR